jgi:predicted O-methyltransferase YrrM
MIAVALSAFTKYEVTNRVKLVEGPAAETLKGIRGEFDIIFIDADKPGYKTYLEIILDKGLLSKNGIIITDNSSLPHPEYRFFLAQCFLSTRFYNLLPFYMAQTINFLCRLL